MLTTEWLHTNILHVFVSNAMKQIDSCRGKSHAMPNIS